MQDIGKQPEVGKLLLTWHDDLLDVCLEVERIESVPDGTPVEHHTPDQAEVARINPESLLESVQAEETGQWDGGPPVK